MDISASYAALSMDWSTNQLQQQVGISVARMVMDNQETAGAAIQQMVQSAAPPSFGHTLDIRV